MYMGVICAGFYSGFSARRALNMSFDSGDRFITDSLLLAVHAPRTSAYVFASAGHMKVGKPAAFLISVSVFPLP